MTASGGHVENASATLLRFYEGRGRDAAGRLFDDVLGFDHARLESTHDFIQWLFPLTTRSAFVPDAPVLDAAALRRFRAEPALRERAVRALALMLDFYGFELDDADPRAIRVERSARFAQRAPQWMAPGDHNLRRITRILTSLRLLGLDAHAQAFFACLSELYRERGGRIGEAAWAHWTRAMRA